MKKSFIIIFVLSFFIPSCLSKPFPKVDNVKIVQDYYDQFYDERISALIYDGTSDEINKLVAKIQTAQTTSIMFVIKEALIDGEFSVDLYQNNENILSYRIFNSQNAYDKIKHRYKKSNRQFSCIFPK